MKRSVVVSLSTLGLALALMGAPVEFNFDSSVVSGKAALADPGNGKGKGNKYTVIFEANKPMLKDPDLIYPGQVLRIPDLDEA